MTEIIASRYELIKLIGSGGMANVYLALDTILNRQVAIKILKGDASNDPVSLERFRREANAATHISHPNIVDIYDVGDENDKHFIVMEYVKGYTLKQLIKNRGAIPPREAVWMIKQLASALLEAHRNGLIHRDVKSQNVLIKDDGTIKLADFGIAVLNNSLQLTSKDSVLGSVHYLAPELAKGQNATMQSDIYSLGIVFYELLSGDVPYKGDTPVQVALKHIKEDLPDLKKFNPDIPQSVINVLLKATAKDPKNRYENIALMIKDLNTCLNENRINEKVIEFKDDKARTFKDFNISSTAEKVKKEQENKSHKKVSTLFIVSISLISIIALVAILFIAGVFSNNSSKFVKVPDVVGLTLASASDAIDVEGLTIDYPIERVLTESTPANEVIEVYPAVGSDVEKNTKIKLVVSNGVYAIMPDYVGQNINKVKKELNSNIIVNIVDVIDETKSEGTIVAQKGIGPNTQYDPTLSQTITFEVVTLETVNIPTQILGLDVDEAKLIIEASGFSVEKEYVAKEDVDDDVLVKYKERQVYACEPEEGTLVSKSEDTVVKLYYYK